MKKLNFYAQVVACTQCPDDLVVRDKDSNVPRGFFTLAEPGDRIRLMMITQNPGQPRPCERGLYSGCTPEETCKKHLEFVENCFFKEGCGRQFHRRLLSWLEYLLGGPKGKEVFRQVVYTNLVKCTTPKNRPPNLCLATICAESHLCEEYKLWNPEIVVGLGRKTQDLLRRLCVEHKELPHPCHRRNDEYPREFLEKLRACLTGKPG